MKLFTRQELKNYDLKVAEGQRVMLTSLETACQKKQKELSALSQEYEDKKAELDREIAAKQMELRTIAKEHELTVISLEERRKVALTPIIAEITQLEGLKEQNIILSKDAAQNLVDAERALNGNKQILERIIMEEKNMRETSFLTMKKLEERMQKSEEAEESLRRMTAFYESKKQDYELARKSHEEKEALLTSSETAIKGKMVLLGQEMEKLTKLKKEVVDERKSLASAIKEIKQRGLWHKVQGMKI